MKMKIVSNQVEKKSQVEEEIQFGDSFIHAKKLLVRSQKDLELAINHKEPIEVIQCIEHRITTFKEICLHMQRVFSGSNLQVIWVRKES